MTDYSTIQSLAGLYLEDSYVLDIVERGSDLTFHIDAVLTESDPRFTPPKPGEQYCYLTGWLVFRDTRVIEWIDRTTTRFRDANNEEDLGNIDFLTVEGTCYHAGGDWGEVKVDSSTPPEFMPDTARA